jgi:hypothetical protein
MNIESASEQRNNQGARSFENVLRGGQADQKAQQAAPPADGRLEQMRAELMQRLAQLPQSDAANALLPELIDSRTRMKLLRDVVSRLDSGSASTNIKGRFTQVENEWFELEKVLRSGQDLSQGELLSLQARLYQVSQHIEVLSKVVDQITSGVKTILHTNV